MIWVIALDFKEQPPDLLSVIAELYSHQEGALCDE
jgi:hypothetical protein